MSEKQLQQDQLLAMPQATPFYRRSSKARKWALPLLIGGALTFLAWRHADQWRPAFGDRAPTTLDLAYPTEAATMSGPVELSHYLQQLEQAFGHPRGDGHHGHHRHHHRHANENDDDETFMDCGHGKFGKVGVAFPPDHLKHKRVPPPPPPHPPHPPHSPEKVCKPKDLTSVEKEFAFSPEEFRRAAIFVDGHFSHGSRVHVRQSDEDGDEVKVKVTLHAERKQLAHSVSVSGFDHDGQYAVEVKRPHHGFHRAHRPKEPPKDDCLLYTIGIVFPANLESYEDLDLHLRSSHVTGNVQDLVFDKFRAGVGRGAIVFESLQAKEVMLGVLHGFIGGKYYPVEKFHAGVIRGAAKTHVFPQGDAINVTVAAVAGVAGLKLPADNFESDLIVNSWSGSPTVEAPNPDDVHITKFTYTTKKGYYKEPNTGSNVVVHTKHGDAKLVFA